MKNPIEIVVADDDAFVRAGVRLYLEPVKEKIEILGEAADGNQTIHAVNSLRPDILLLDLQMPKVNGWDLIEQFKHSHPNLKIIVLSAHEETDYVSKAILAGARGYLTKSSLEQELQWAIQIVASNHAAIKYNLLAQTLSIPEINNLANKTTAEKRSPQAEKQVRLKRKSKINLKKQLLNHPFLQQLKKVTALKLKQISQKISKFNNFAREFQFSIKFRFVHTIVIFLCSLSLTILITTVVIALD